MFYSFFKSGELVSRDIRFAALPYGVYKIIENCMKYSLNTLLVPNRFECMECTKHTLPNESRTFCARKPFSSCGMVYDFDFRICKQCFYTDLFYLFENSKCLPRTPSRFDRCLEFSKFSDSCLKCKPPFILNSSICTIPSEIPSALETLPKYPESTNCLY